MPIFNLKELEKNKYWFSKLSFKPLLPKKKETNYLSAFPNEYILMALMFTWLLSRLLFEPASDWWKRNKGWCCAEKEIETRDKT